MKELRYRFSTGFFITLAVALLIFGSKDNATVSKLRSDLSAFFVPVLDVISRPLEAMDDAIQWTQDVAIVFSENKRLREENDLLKQAQIKASQLAIDNQRLKKLLNIDEGQVKTVAAARVVADSGSPFFKSVLINRGSQDGLQNRQAVIVVDDSGAGIEAEHIPRLTEPFYRVDPSRQRKTGGYGLGLYLCRMIAQAHAGSLEIESTPGTGTRIIVRLPIS